MIVLRTLGRFFAWVRRGVRRVVSEDQFTDIRATYPDQKGPTGEQVASNVSLGMGGDVGHPG